MAQNGEPFDVQAEKTNETVLDSRSTGSGDLKAPQLYTIVYSTEIQNSLEPGFLVLDNLANERPDWREYWPIRSFLLTNSLDDSSYYGFFSPKFSAKTGLSYADVCSFVENSGVDVCIFSPQPDMGSFFINVFEQNDVFDRGFSSLAQKVFDTLGIDLRVNDVIMDSRHVIFSNFIVAKKAFWDRWLVVCESLFALCESHNDELAQQLNAGTTYQGIPRKVFMIERIASVVLRTGNWRVKSYDTFQCAWSSLGTNQYKHEAVISDALKLAHNELGHPEYLSAFAELRNLVFGK